MLFIPLDPQCEDYSTRMEAWGSYNSRGDYCQMDREAWWLLSRL